MRNQNQEFDEYDLEEMIEQPAAPPLPEEDETAPRYGFSFLVNVPLFKHLGNNVLLDVHKRDESGTVIKNTMYFPRLMLIPFKNIQAPIPAELPASRTTSGSYEANMRAFNPDAADAQDAMLRTTRKTALKCAELFVNTYGKEGGVLLNSLTGIETYRQAKELLTAVLPLGDTEIFPRFTRNVLGEEFVSPFLDEILEYLQSAQARERINRYAGDSRALQDVLPVLYNEILTGARNANTIAKGQIATTEQQISATPQQKSGYDLRDTQFAGAPDPFDLVCLAHRGERPKSERALDEARKLQEASNEPLAEAAKSMNQVAKFMLQNQQQSQVPTGAPIGMTPAEIAELVRIQVAEGIRAFAASTSVDVPIETAPAAAPIRKRADAKNAQTETS